jgi:hypothetical protein
MYTGEIFEVLKAFNLFLCAVEARGAGVGVGRRRRTASECHRVSTSMPTACLPTCLEAIRVAPLPQNGSNTASPLTVNASMSLVNSATGFSQGWLLPWVLPCRKTSEIGFLSFAPPRTARIIRSCCEATFKCGYSMRVFFVQIGYAMIAHPSFVMTLRNSGRRRRERSGTDQSPAECPYLRLRRFLKRRATLVGN